MSLIKSILSNKNYRVAAVVALLTLAWLASGLMGDKQDVIPAAEVAGEETLPLVQAARLQAQPYATTVVVNSSTEPNRSVRLRAELDGVITKVPVEEGSNVSAGTVICEVGEEDRRQKLVEAEAQLAKARLEYQGAQKLISKGLNSQTALAQFKAALETARVVQKRAELDIERLQIKAPYAGVVNRRMVELGDFVRRGEDCAVLLDLDPILVVGQVSESQVGLLRKGSTARAKLQVGGEITGTLRYISSETDPITRAYRVEVAVPNADGKLRAGISGRLALPTGEMLAHKISPSLLTLDDEGLMGVRIVDDQGRVRFVRVNLVGDAADGVWVTGLPREILLITVGQEYVGEGDLVKVSIEETTGANKVIEPVGGERTEPRVEK
ncbi:efflux RND transporter periplasmic adaptor subunit [Biformimicrobium ophioploci]|uniref:Multidrug efflux RND transporter periplasmic adaptor subunit VmeJ n=1 Tax=Biformimicrobium ophioploci TaxID=3036711 RepID=A0ABQ6LYH3_9GAMM|nr:efflux RND transporter periplasmic adaptor subunit [Microbulbifer sp. NKW57]GMG87153.1 multidrug efflux RND transporter periplasmic adaptor subunit VmeJ [Microbulbifer sp. NKW57]